VGRRQSGSALPPSAAREIVAASYAPGAPVSVVAQQFEVNVNQVHGFDADSPPASPAPQPRPLPVTIGMEIEGGAAPPSGAGPSDTITIEVAGTYLVRVGANFDGLVLRRLLNGLSLWIALFLCTLRAQNKLQAAPKLAFFTED
jgi:transposase